MCSEQVSEGNENPLYNLERAKNLCGELAEKYDTVRAKYWQFMAETIEKESKKEPEGAEGGPSQ